MTAKTIEALKVIRNQLDLIIESEGEVSIATTGVAVDSPVAVEGVVVSDEVPAPDSNVVGFPKPAVDNQSPNIDMDVLTQMPYAELKKFAKQLGVSGAGSRSDILDRITDFAADCSPDEQEDKSVESEPTPDNEHSEDVSSKPKTTKKNKKLGGSKKNVEPEPELDVNDPVYQKVMEATEDMSDEDIMDFLADCDIKAKGKRNSLISVLIQAVHEGKISLDDDEEEEDGEDNTSSDQITPERKAAIEESRAELEKQIDSGDITRNDLEDWYCEVYEVTKKSVNKMDDEELVEAYAEALALFIDDEGVTHGDDEEEEKEPYFVNGEPYCCGEKLKYNKEDGTYICEVCGSEYDASEDEE